MSYDREKRDRPRARVKWPVILQTDQGDIQGETLNITVDGALIRCQETLEPDETIEIVINVPTLLRPLKILAQVIHSSVSGTADEISYYQIGVRFAELSKKNRWLISTAVQRESGVMLMP